MDIIQINSKLRLEKVQLNMAQVIFEAIDQNRDFLARWLPFVEETLSVRNTEDFIKSVLSQHGKRRDEVYTVWYKQEFAGLIGFKDTDWINLKTELGYWLVPRFQGKGIVTTCVQTLLKFSFGKLRLNRVQIKVAVGNEKSRAIPIRLGFKFEGIEREGEFHHGKFLDLEVYSILRFEMPG